MTTVQGGAKEFTALRMTTVQGGAKEFTALRMTTEVEILQE